MELYISKSALVAELESRIKKYTKRGVESDATHDGYGMYWGGVLSCLNELLSLCDTLEVKEVDLNLGSFDGDVGVSFGDRNKMVSNKVHKGKQNVYGGMKGTPDKIYIATKERNYSNTQDLEFNIILENPPTGGVLYREYIGVSVVNELLEKLRVVCGNSAMHYVDKQIKKINEHKEYIEL